MAQFVLIHLQLARHRHGITIMTAMVGAVLTEVR